MGSMNSYLLVVVLGGLVSPLLGASDAREQQEGVKKLEEAISKTNIFDLPSFRMTASVQIIGNDGKTLDGQYLLLWNGPEQWREEIVLPGYTEVQIGGKGTAWIHRSTEVIPLRIHELRAALGFGSVAGESVGGSFVQLVLSPKDRIKRTHSRKEHGEKLTCVEIENEWKHSFDVCVDDGTGSLVRGLSYKDGDLQPVGGKVFPRFLSFVENGKTVVKVNVSQIVVPGQFGPNSFALPAGASPEAGCMNPTPFRRIKSVAPKYPQDAREQHIQGFVAVDVWIGTDGVQRIHRAVVSPSPSLEKSAMDSIADWRYEPAECNGQPVQVETVLRINYTLSP